MLPRVHGYMHTIHRSSPKQHSHRCSFPRSFVTYIYLSILGEGANGDSYNVLQRQRELLIVSLVEKLCTMYGTNQRRNKRFFARVCAQLGYAGILTDQMVKSDEIAHLRERCENGFFNLMDSVKQIQLHTSLMYMDEGRF